MTLGRPICSFLFLSAFVVAGAVGGHEASSMAGTAAGAVDSEGAARALQTSCPTLCPSGTEMTSGDSSLPIFTDGPQTCSAVEALLEAQDSTACTVVGAYLNFLDLAAYCGCTGSSKPDLCSGCSNGGSVTQPDSEFTVPLLNNVTFSCRQAANFVSYLTSAFACTGFTRLFDAACCTASSTGNSTAAPAAAGGTTSSPAAAAVPTMTTGSPVSAPAAPTAAMPTVPTVNMPTVPTVNMPTVSGPTAGGAPSVLGPTAGGAPSVSPYPSATSVPSPLVPSASTDQPSASAMPAAADPSSPTSPTAPTSPTPATSMAVSVTGSYVGAIAVMLTVVVASYT